MDFDNQFGSCESTGLEKSNNTRPKTRKINDKIPKKAVDFNNMLAYQRT